MHAIQLLNPQKVHLRNQSAYRCPFSKTLGSLSSRERRGDGGIGVSSASQNAFHCSAFNPNRRLSGSNSSARSSALSRTKSVTDLREAAAERAEELLPDRRRFGLNAEQWK